MKLIFILICLLFALTLYVLVPIIMMHENRKNKITDVDYQNYTIVDYEGREEGSKLKFI